MRTATIHLAYAVSRRNGVTYRARAYVLESGNPALPASHTFRHSFTVGIGDTAQEAKADAIRYIEEMHARDGVPAPQAIEDHGRKSAAIVDGLAF